VALLVFDFAQLVLFEQPRLFDLPFAALTILAFASLEQGPGAGIHLAGRELTQHLLRALILSLIGPWLLESTVLWLLLRNGLRLVLLRLLQPMARDRALALRLNKNGFGAAMTKILADVALLDRPLHIQRHGLPAASRFIVRLFNFAHSLPWRRR
jgi:hypothetical protein